MQEEFGKVKEKLISKLAQANDCIHLFLASMQRLQKGVLKKDEANMEKLKKDFETNKNHLLAMDKELKELTGKESCICSGREQTHSRSLGFSNTTKPIIGKAPLNEAELKNRLEIETQIKMQSLREDLNKEKLKMADSTKHCKEEIENLKSIQSQLTAENVKLKSYIESQKKESEDSIVNQLNEASENYEKLLNEYKKTLATHEQSEVRLKKSIKDLDGTLKIKNKEIERLLKKMSENNLNKNEKIIEVKSRIKKIAQEIEAKMLQRNLNIQNRAVQQLNQLDELRGVLAEKLDRLSSELAEANKQLELEKFRAQEFENKDVEQSFQLNELLKENGVLKQKIDKIQMDYENQMLENKKLEEEKSELQQQLENELARENGTADNLNTEYQEKIAEYEQIISLKEEQLGCMTSIITNEIQGKVFKCVQSQKINLFNKCQQLNKKIIQLQNKVFDLIEKNRLNTQELNKTCKELRVSHVEDVKGFQETIEEKNVQIQELQLEKKRVRDLFGAFKEITESNVEKFVLELVEKSENQNENMKLLLMNIAKFKKSYKLTQSKKVSVVDYRKMFQNMLNNYNKKQIEYNKLFKNLNNKLSPMNEKLAEIKEYLSVQKTNIKAHKDTINDLSNQIQEKKNDFEEFREHIIKIILAKLQGFCGNYDNLLSKITGKNAKMLNKLTILQKQFVEMKNKQQNGKKIHQDLLIRIEELNKSLKAKEKEGKDSRSMIQSKEAIIEKLEKNSKIEIEMHKKEMDEILEKSKKDYESKLSKILSNIAISDEQKKLQQTKSIEKSAVCMKNIKLFSAKKAELFKIYKKEIIELISKQNEQLRETITKISTIHKKEKGKLQSIDNAKKKLEMELMQMMKNNKSLSDENRELKKSSRDLENLLESQKIELEKEKARLTELEERYNCEKKDKENVFKSKDEEKLATEEYISKKEQENKLLNTKLFNLRKQASKLRQDIASIKDQNKENIGDLAIILKNFSSAFYEELDDVKRRIIQFSENSKQNGLIMQKKQVQLEILLNDKDVEAVDLKNKEKLDLTQIKEKLGDIKKFLMENSPFNLLMESNNYFTELLRRLSKRIYSQKEDRIKNLKLFKDKIKSNKRNHMENYNKIVLILKEQEKKFADSKLKITQMCHQTLKSFSMKNAALQADLSRTKADLASQIKEKKLLEEEKVTLKSIIKDSEEQLAQQKQEINENTNQKLINIKNQILKMKQEYNIKVKEIIAIILNQDIVDNFKQQIEIISKKLLKQISIMQSIIEYKVELKEVRKIFANFNISLKQSFADSIEKYKKLYEYRNGKIKAYSEVLKDKIKQIYNENLGLKNKLSTQNTGNKEKSIIPNFFRSLIIQNTDKISKFYEHFSNKNTVMQEKIEILKKSTARIKENNYFALCQLEYKHKIDLTTKGEKLKSIIEDLTEKIHQKYGESVSVIENKTKICYDRIENLSLVGEQFREKFEIFKQVVQKQNSLQGKEIEILGEKLKKSAFEYDEMIRANSDLNNKINKLQQQCEENKDFMSPVLFNEKKLLNSPTPEFGDRKMSSSSLNAYPVHNKEKKQKTLSSSQQDPLFMKTIKQNFMLCVQNVPSK